MATDNTFVEELRKLNETIAKAIATMHTLPDADPKFLTALGQMNIDAIAGFMTGRFNQAQAQGGGVPAAPPSPGQSPGFGGGAQGYPNVSPEDLAGLS